MTALPGLKQTGIEFCSAWHKPRTSCPTSEPSKASASRNIVKSSDRSSDRSEVRNGLVESAS